MSFWKEKKILIAITGSIAAYKIPFLIRFLVKEKAAVKVLMTSESCNFVAPLVLSTLSKNKISKDFVDENGIWNDHVALGLWADFILIAPATANTLSKMSSGQSDNLIVATYLSAKCPVYFAPAMDLDMYQHPATQKNIKTLESYGNILIPADFGELASGLVGQGRMQEPQEIMNFIQNNSEKTKSLKGKKILITGGPTYEKIDPVRFIGNHSSGKMAIALVEEALFLGAEVILIMGPTSENIPKNITCDHIINAAQMQKAVQKYYEKVDIIIAAAAVSDYTPKNPFQNKIKKKNDNFSIALEPTQDILEHIGKQKKHQILVGFALETENEIPNATKKLHKKNLDMIILNSLKDKGAGFGKTTNKITIIKKQSAIKKMPLQTKKQVAATIFQEILDL